MEHAPNGCLNPICQFDNGGGGYFCRCCWSRIPSRWRAEIKVYSRHPSGEGRLLQKLQASVRMLYVADSPLDDPLGYASSIASGHVATAPAA